MKKYDFEERTFKFSKDIIHLCKQLNINRVNMRLSDQLIRSATSIGANYCEANETDSKKDFRNKIRIAKKEAKETIYWIRLILDSNSYLQKQIESLLDEANQLMKILASIYLKLL